MIQIKKIEIFEFRGVRKLEIDFKQKSFAICGRNGTGKSGIVDAIEFALTGNISRLAGAGTGGISVKEHAPHVDCRKSPELSKVTLTVFLTTINKEATIERCVNDVDNPVIKPNSPAVLEAMKDVAGHPEFALSRRELIKYVLSSPSDRSKEIQALLRLEKIETLRANLQKIANADKKELTPLTALKEQAKQQLLSALGISVLKSENVLEAINTKRKKLGLSEIVELKKATSFSEGLAEEQAKADTIVKSAALVTIKQLKEVLLSYSEATKLEAFQSLQKELSILSLDVDKLNHASREQFLRTALTVIDDDHCPVCETPMEAEELRILLQGKLKNYESVTETRRTIEESAQQFVLLIDQLIGLLNKVREYGGSSKPVIDTNNIALYVTDIELKAKAIRSFLPFQDTVEAVASYGQVPKAITDKVDDIEKAINALPDLSDIDEAKFFLRAAQEKLETYRISQAKHKIGSDKEAISSLASKTYGEVVTKSLDDLYKRVESKFVEFYRFINSDDESAFDAKLNATSGKLGFNVDFYGRGFFSPGAYHSEGHQDGMGLCLYLALMDHILGDNFSFAVLDDVLMSVDSGHRREVCRLLKEKFPKTQFILTTHDEVWLKHMKTAGLISGKAHVQFRKWDVANGPNQWEDKDIWTEINNYLDGGDVRSAAALLRHYLEYISAEFCHKLRASVEFRGDAQFSLGDLLPPAIQRMAKLLDDGIKSANSWGKVEIEENIKLRKAEFEKLRAESNVDSWQTNVSVHYNEWANLHEREFRPVVSSFQNLISSFRCNETNCDSVMYVVPERGNKEFLRCSCGSVSINLVKK